MNAYCVLPAWQWESPFSLHSFYDPFHLLPHFSLTSRHQVPPIKKKLLIYYFWLYWFFIAVLGLCPVAGSGGCSSYASWASHCGDVSCCGAWALECVDSVVVGHGLRCSLVCGILVPGPRIEPVSPVMVGKFLTTGPPGKSPHSFYSNAKELG